MDKKIETKIITLMAAFMMVLVSLSLGVVAGQENDEYEDIVLVERYGISEEVVFNILDDLNVDLIENYDNAVLVEADKTVIESLENYGLTVSRIPKRTTIYVGGSEFDFREGEPEIPDELRVNDYEPGVKGQYIVHMVGPIARSWRPTLEGMGVQVLNYMHNHAYRVRMTPELASEVSELYFVDWVSIYHPYYKLQPELQPGIVNIGMVPGSGTERVDEVMNLANVISFTELTGGGGYLVKAEVDTKDVLYELVRVTDVDYVYQYVEAEYLDEMATQIVGGGCWFFDDEYPHSGGPHRMGNPDIPYGLHGPFGSYMNQIGYTGNGIVIAVADSGLGGGTIEDQHEDFQSRVIGGIGWVYDPDPTIPGYWDEDNWVDLGGHGTGVAGIAAGNTFYGTGETVYNDYFASVGTAPGSELYPVAHVLFAPPYEIIQVAAENSNANVHTNSWGHMVDGDYDSTSHDYDRAVRDFDMVVTAAAGNEGYDEENEEIVYGFIRTPGTAKNVITVGGTYNYNPDEGWTNPEKIVNYSSRGWAADNRVKPDVVAPAHRHNTTKNDDNAGYRFLGGTSAATPAVAGAAAVTTEWYKENHDEQPSPAMVKALLINTANDLCNENGNTGPIPNRDEGWGIVDISKLERPDPIPFYLYDQEHVFDDSGQIHEHVVVRDRNNEPLKFTLVWTDRQAGNVGSAPSLINDLNLEVISHCGAVYRGNAFPVDNEGNSTSSYTSPNIDTMPVFDRNDDGWDDTNNVENIFIHPDDVEIGNYTVRIRAKNIASDAVGLGYNSQDYALVVYNAALNASATDPAFPTIFNMREKQHENNDLPAFKLTNPTSYEPNLQSSSIDYTDDTAYTVNWGLRVFIRDVNGDETELTNGGLPHAVVSRSSSGSGYQSAVWNQPWIDHIYVEDNDALVVRVYAEVEGKVPWTEQATFISYDLVEHLEGETCIRKPSWTVYYYTKYATGLSLPPGSTTTFGYLYWGTLERNSRIEDILFGEPGGAIEIISYSSDTDNMIIEWTAQSKSGISYYEIRLDDGEWMNMGTNTIHTFYDLEEEKYTVTVRMKDNGDRTWEATTVVYMNEGPPP